MPYPVLAGCCVIGWFALIAVVWAFVCVDRERQRRIAELDQTIDVGNNAADYWRRLATERGAEINRIHRELRGLLPTDSPGARAGAQLRKLFGAHDRGEAKRPDPPPVRVEWCDVTWRGRILPDGQANGQAEGDA